MHAYRSLCQLLLLWVGRGVTGATPLEPSLVGWSINGPASPPPVDNLRPVPQSLSEVSHKIKCQAIAAVTCSVIITTSCFSSLIFFFPHFLPFLLRSPPASLLLLVSGYAFRGTRTRAGGTCCNGLLVPTDSGLSPVQRPVPVTLVYPSNPHGCFLC